LYTKDERANPQKWDIQKLQESREIKEKMGEAGEGGEGNVEENWNRIEKVLKEVSEE
jgi:hypothetical protein